MARPPAISMHRARGASVPGRRHRIRRPGRARRAAALQPGPCRPRARPPPARPAAPIVPRARAAGRPRPPAPEKAAARPAARRCKFGPSAPARPPGDARELGESREACGRHLRGRAWAPLARRAFVFGQDKGPARRGARARGDRVPRTPLGRGSGSPCREAEAGRERGAGPGSAAWPCAPPAPSRSRPAGESLGRGHRFAPRGEGRRGGKGSVRSPELGPAAPGLAAAGGIARRGLRPARARLPTCAPRGAEGFGAAPEDGKCLSHFG